MNIDFIIINHHHNTTTTITSCDLRTNITRYLYVIKQDDLLHRQDNKGRLNYVISRLRNPAL